MMRKFLLKIALICTACLLQGCVIAAVGVGAAGTIAYVRGDLQTVESEPIDVVYEASLEALGQLELHATSKSKDALVARIVSYDAQGKKIQIKLKATTDKTTGLSIRIGTFGNETKSMLIHQKIRDSLRERREARKAEADKSERVP